MPATSRSSSCCHARRFLDALAPPPPPPPPPANNAIPFLHLEEKTWKKGDEAEDIPEEPPEIGFLELEAEVDAACDGLRDAGNDAAKRVRRITDDILGACVFAEDAADPNDADVVRPASVNEIRAVELAATTLKIETREARTTRARTRGTPHRLLRRAPCRRSSTTTMTTTPS